MEKSAFESLIIENDKGLQIIRNKYFPLIEQGIITGYNIYILNYLTILKEIYF